MYGVSTSLAAALLLAGPLAGAPAALAEGNPRSWAVTGVASDDVLNMRDVPSGDARKVGSIPPGARGVKNLGCLRKHPSLEEWMGMSEDARRDAKLLWCRVEYGGKQGWVAARFLKDADNRSADEVAGAPAP